MPTDTKNADTPVSVEKKCPNCGNGFPAGGRGMGKTFCSAECRKAYHRLAIIEGPPLAPLVKAWNATRHAKPGTREAAICTFARSQLTEIARIFLDRDEEEGRDAVSYVGSLMDSGMLFVDRMKG